MFWHGVLLLVLRIDVNIVQDGEVGGGGYSVWL